MLRETRYLDPVVRIDAFIKLYDATVILVSFGKEPIAVVIESEGLAQTLKALFDIAWATAKQVTEKDVKRPPL